MARNSSDRSQNFFIVYSLLPYSVYEFFAQALVAVCIFFRHFAAKLNNYPSITNNFSIQLPSNYFYFCASLKIMVNIGVLGAGHLGKIHLKLLKEIPGVNV